MIEYWNNFYKHELGTLAIANLVYEPLISPNKTIFKMNFNSNQYFVNPNMTDDFRRNWFSREINYIEKLKHKPYAPEINNIDHRNRTVEFKWYDRSLSKLIHTGEISAVTNWQQQIKDILADLLAENIRKSNLYPHTFYMDHNDRIRIMDLYGCSSAEDRYVSKELLTSILFDSTHPRFAQSLTGEIYDTFKLYELTVKMNYGDWPGDFLNA
jgi:hypothetical protein